MEVVAVRDDYDLGPVPAEVPVPTGAEDRIAYEPDGTVDEIVLRHCTVHIEMLTTAVAYVHLTDAAGRMVRGHLTAVKLTPAQRRIMRAGSPHETPPTAALLITVEDDEIGLGG